MLSVELLFSVNIPQKRPSLADRRSPLTAGSFTVAGTMRFAVRIQFSVNNVGDGWISRKIEMGNSAGVAKLCCEKDEADLTSGEKRKGYVWPESSYGRRHRNHVIFK